MTHGKSYLVTKSGGRSPVHREGAQVGTWPEIGYSLQVFGVCTGIAGTELAAHALAEVYRNIEPHRRRWVLTEQEYEEHRQILQDDTSALLAKFPYSQTEKSAIDDNNSRYATVIANGEANIKQKLLNISPYEYFHWDPNPLTRPETFPAPAGAIREPEHESADEPENLPAPR